MTKQEWLVCADPEKMLTFLSRPGSYRKFRLFACACVRRVWHLLRDERSRAAVEMGERYADGLVSSLEVMTVEEAAQEVTGAAHRGESGETTVAYAAAVTIALWAPAPWGAGEAARSIASRRLQGRQEERKAQADLLRDLFGPSPSRAASVQPAILTWNDGIVRHLAESIYDYRAFERLPILADALEEAGCTDHDILSHCRQPGDHVRGCWVVDLLLGKS